MVMRQMLFGPKFRERMVPTMRIDPDYTRQGYSSVSALVNGGASVERSLTAAKKYAITWPMRGRQITQMILGMAEGVWGDELIYFVDPFAMDQNLADQQFGNPALAAMDGLTLFYDGDVDVVPSLSPITYDPVLMYPNSQAVYEARGTSRKIYVPIVPGHVAWVGAHGSATGAAGMRVTPYVSSSAQTPTTLTMLPVNTPTLVNTPFSSADGLTGIEVDALVTSLLKNLSPNPSSEANLAYTGAITTGYTQANAATTPTLTQVAGGFAGSFSARVTFPTTTATAPGAGAYKDTPVEAGKTYSFGMYYRTSKVTRVVPVLEWLDGNGLQIGSDILGTQVVTTALPAWASAPRAVIQGQTAPAGAATGRLSVISVSGTSYSAWASGNYIEIDALQVNEGAVLQAYADGNTSGWRWRGAINSSISETIPDTLTFAGLVIQMLPIGVTPTAGPWIPGQGHSGCRFTVHPTRTPHSAGLDLDEISAVLLEVGAWE